MSKRVILLFGALSLFTNDSFSQDFVEDLSVYQSILLDTFAKARSVPNVFIQKSYLQEDFITASEELRKLYFVEVGNSLKESDSLSVSDNFKKLPRVLSRQYERETKKIVKKLKRCNISVSIASDYIVEPRYLIRIEHPNPVAYTLNLEYILINKPENMIYRLVF